MEWNDMRAKVEEFSKGNKDFKISSKKLRVNPEGLRSLKQYNFTDHSLQQLCNKIGVPFKYAKKCREDAPELFIDNLQHWMYKEDTQYLLRTNGDNLRAVLSDRYSVLDNLEVVDNLPEMKIKDFYMSDHYFSLRCIFDTKINVTRKDPVFLGVSVTNSEVGLKKASIDICLWRQVCSNGLIICEETEHYFKQRHLWVKKENLKEDFKIACKAIEEVGESYLQKFKATVNTDVTDSDTLVDVNFKEFTEEFRNSLKEKMAESSNLYEVINIITDTAKVLPFEQKFKAEQLAGKILLAS